MKCAACGGAQASDSYVRRLKGCDKPLEGRKAHVIRRGNLEPLVTKSCPRKQIKEVSQYFNVYNWANKGLLQYQYPPGQLPAKYAEALDLIDYEFEEKSRILTEAKDGKTG